MSNSKRLITKYFRTHMARQLVESITEPANTAYYMFTGKHMPYENGDTAITQPVNTYQSLYIDTYNNMMFGKRVSENDIAYMIARNDWASGTVYDMYQHDDADLFDKKYFVVVNEGGLYHVYKCLFNNNGAPSTVAPNFNDTSPEDEYYQTSDGYQWKYMFTVDKTTFQKFSTINYMPVNINADVTANATPGAIDVITVVTPGAGYNNYLYGRFNATDIRVGGNNTIYAVAADGAGTNGYYASCYLYISSGTGKGQYKEIIDYRVRGTSKEVILSEPFSIPPDATSVYEITPIVQMRGDGVETRTCVARALIDATSSNSVYRVEVLDRGEGYRSATATVLYSNVVPVSNTAGLKVIQGPKGGHGSDVIDELNASRVGFSVKFSNTENGTIQATNDFRTAGLLKDPKFANVELNITPTGTFIGDETIYEYTPIKLYGTVSINTTSNTIIGTNTLFDTQLQPGDAVVINSGVTSFLTRVSSVVSNTSLTLAEAGPFVNSTATFALAKLGTAGKVKTLDTNRIEVTDVAGIFTTGATIIGSVSSATAVINSIKINNVSKTFNTFNQMKVFVGTPSSTFTPDEVVIQPTIGSVPATADLHSINTSESKMYVTNQSGIINAGGNTLVGSISNAEFTISAKYPGDLVVDSGDVIYVENFPAIERADDRSETIKIIVEF